LGRSEPPLKIAFLKKGVYSPTELKSAINQMPPKKSLPAQSPLSKHWNQRVHSKAFKVALKKFYLDDMTELSKMRLGDVVDDKIVRRMIREFEFDIFDQKEMTQLVLSQYYATTNFLKKKNFPVSQLLDAKTIRSIEKVVDENVIHPKQFEKILKKIMEQEFIGKFFTDMVHLSIVSFYKKVNPIFGGITVSLLEKQIKGFIGLFIPLVQERATAFVVSPENQALLIQFCRNIFLMMLDEPMGRFVTTPSVKKKKQIETLLREGQVTQEAVLITRQGLLIVFDECYKTLSKKRLKDLFNLNPKNLNWLASNIVEIALPQLQRAHVQEFFVKEIELAMPQ
jgi:hypothetical protein